MKAYFAAKRLHKEIPFDLFHHITYANDWIASFIGALLPTPYVRGPGGGAHRTPRGFEKEYRFISRLWEKVRGPAQWVFRHDPFFVKGQHRARAILVCNQESRSSIPKKWSHKVHLFPVNGVSSTDLSLAASGESGNDHFRVLTAGSLIRVKGFTLAIKAFSRFAAARPETTFSIIGSGPEESRLRELVRRSELDDQVHFIQAMPRHELLSMMASHDVFLFPSLRDGGGAVVIEAMSAGKPVVCLDTGGPGMHVTDKCGVKIAPDSYDSAAEELAGALERLYLDEGLRSKMGRAARERVEKHYHWDRLGERLNVIYQRALESPKPD
jgi:glycosyltransferase involved in cell wall biosynthesis